ncbi:hypothetical protein F4819DRAFT_489380 [Hypoxylon fuscum]|nr:hypothetical protein F4819DRAFT_489380 [Hypoxylon fuscum]
MDNHHNSDEPDGSKLYAAPPTPAQPPNPQARSGLRKWGLRQIPVQDPGCDNISTRGNRGSVVLRSSVAYPSDSTFEASIVSGTAQTGLRYPTKPRLIDLSRLRCKTWGSRRPSSSHAGSSTANEAASLSSSPSSSEEEDAAEDRATMDRRAATEMYHHAIVPAAKTSSPMPSRESLPAPPSTPSYPTKQFKPPRRPLRHILQRKRTFVGSLEAGCASIVPPIPTKGGKNWLAQLRDIMKPRVGSRAHAEHTQKKSYLRGSSTA